MPISTTGDGLGVLIACEYLPHHNWMAFLAWYSLTKNLPDAKVAIACKRHLMRHDLFRWPQKCQVPYILHPAGEDSVVVAERREIITAPFLTIQPDTVAVRDFEEAGFSPDALDRRTPDVSGLVADCKDETPCVFATYPNGWGKFVTSSWINKESCPFGFTKYGSGSMTSNEARIGKLWSACAPLFQIVSRG